MPDPSYPEWRGWHRPRYTPVPDQLFDEWLAPGRLYQDPLGVWCVHCAECHKEAAPRTATGCLPATAAIAHYCLIGTGWYQARNWRYYCPACAEPPREAWRSRGEG
jgi:hypothetical protein